MYANVTTMKKPSNFEWAERKKCEDSEAHKHFFERFISVYDNFLPKVKVRMRTKSLHGTWITKGTLSLLKGNTNSMKNI